MKDKAKKLPQSEKAIVPFTSYRDVPQQMKFRLKGNGTNLFISYPPKGPVGLKETGLYLAWFGEALHVAFATLLRDWETTVDNGRTFQPAGLPAPRPDPALN